MFQRTVQNYFKLVLKQHYAFKSVQNFKTVQNYFKAALSCFKTTYSLQNCPKLFKNCSYTVLKLFLSY